MAGGMSRKELLNLPVAVPLEVAARALDIGRKQAQQLALDGEFPCRVLRVGRRYKVPTVGEGGLLAVLGVPVEAYHQPHLPAAPAA